MHFGLTFELLTIDGRGQLRSWTKNRCTQDVWGWREERITLIQTNGLDSVEGIPGRWGRGEQGVEGALASGAAVWQDWFLVTVGCCPRGVEKLSQRAEHMRLGTRFQQAG